MKGVRFAQVENIEFVDPRRHDQQRRLVGLFGQRGVLDELHQVVFEHDRALRGGDILTDGELRIVGHADGELAFAALQIGQQVVQPVDQILALGFERRAQHFRIGCREIGRRHRVDPLSGKEFHLVGGAIVETFGFRDRFLDMLRGQQIGLLDEFEGGVFGPGRVLETPVARLGRNLRRRRSAADHALRRFAPEIGVVGPEPGLHLPHAGGVGHHLAGQLHECAPDIQRIRVRPAGLLLRGHEILHDFPAAFGDGRELFGSGGHIGRRLGMRVGIRFGHGADPFRPLANKVRSHKQAVRPRRQKGSIRCRDIRKTGDIRKICSLSVLAG